ncbi:ABC transporter family substrate-binding protein [Lysinimonas soli]|uniref:ABC transporter family substrate-binding protein n=1 Tax=Lysinimonas soli TaxID=1074233 RepID=A0ABW0NN26_9MICO
MNTMNSFTATNYATYNSNVSYLYQGVGFNYYDNSPKLVKNPAFGTYKKLSDSPLTVQYTINDGVKWTDGTPVDAADMILAWGSSITKYNDPKGVNFGSINAGSGLDYVTKMPKIGSDGRTITLTYDKPYVDWEILPAITPNIPSAVLWEEAGIDKKTGKDAQDAVVKAFKDDDTSTLTKLAKIWKTGFDMTSTPKDAKLLTTYGPYKVQSLTKQYVTLVSNPDFTWGPKPKIAKITVRFIPDQTAQVQALQNGELSVLYGQATADTVSALKGASGIKSTTTPTATFEHVDLTFNNNGPFDPATYGGDAQKALEVRQAFFKVIPRQQMLERLITPISPNVKLDDSSLFLPGQQGYDESVKNNGSSDYQTVDVAAAKALLAKAGVTGPVTVRFAYANDNPRRQGEFQLIQASAKDAGFNVVDVGKPGADFFGPDGIGSGKYVYDATVFAYQLSSGSVTQSQANTTTGNAYNYQGYSNTKVDALWQKAATVTSSADAIPLQQQIDGYLWKDASTLTLFQLPDVSAWSSKISNVSDAPYSPNIFWNFWEWTESK